MTRSIRALLGLAAIAAATSVAGAQTSQDQTTPRAGRAAATAGSQSASKSSKSSSHRAKAARRHRNVSAGEVSRDLVGTGPHAMARDFVGADDPRCDDLCQHEKMMDARYGKDRERRGGS